MEFIHIFTIIVILPIAFVYSPDKRTKHLVLVGGVLLLVAHGFSLAGSHLLYASRFTATVSLIIFLAALIPMARERFRMRNR